jgi:hypothetical protein
MKKLFAVVFAIVLLATTGGVALAAQSQTGNGAPSGPHYNLNIIGMDNDNGKECEDGGHVIFVQLGKAGEVTKSTKILLSEGAHETDFYVEDCDGTDGQAAFRLPNPDPENSGTTEYCVFMRVLGSPKNNPMVEMETCATNPEDGEEVCSDYTVIKTRSKGKSSFTNVSKELLYIYAWICVDYDEDTKTCLEWDYVRVPLFGDELEDYLWKYHNTGVRLVQLRFYHDCSVTVPEPEPPPE